MNWSAIFFAVVLAIALAFPVGRFLNAANRPIGSEPLDGDSDYEAGRAA